MLEDEFIPEWWQLSEDRWPTDAEEIAIILTKDPAALKLQDSEGKGDAYRIMLSRLRQAQQDLLASAREQNPLAFWRPSYEQALMLNAWIWGYGFVVCFSANRIGKTTALIVNALLWIFPNDPSWVMFKGYTDEFGNFIKIIPRPPLTKLRDIQKFFKRHPALVGDHRYPAYLSPYSPDYDPQRAEKSRANHLLVEEILAEQQLEHEEEEDLRRCKWPSSRPLPFRPIHAPAYPEASMTKGGQLWVGCPDFDFAEKNIMPKWKSLCPPSQMMGYSLSNHECTIQSMNARRTTHEISFKSYDSDDTKWSGDAVHGIILTEGLPQSIFNEAKLRLAEPAFASWDYTPYEARNTGTKVALAYKVFKGQEHLPLHPVVYTKFSARHAPTHILPIEKLQDMILSYGTHKEGIARLDGDFYSSSGLVLGKLNPSHHYISLTFQELLARYPNQLRFFRGLDPGYDHPTACAYLALTPTNTWFLFRFYCERGKTIPERCAEIITFSGNLREKEFYGSGPDDYQYREVHPNPDLSGAIPNPSIPFVTTITDYHMFKSDETTRQSYANHYIKQGLRVSRSITLNQEDRAMEVDKLLDPLSHQFHPHPITRRPPGARLYFLINEPGVAEAAEKLENLFWERLKSGDNKGQPKDKVPTHGDDELDAISYPCGSPHKYSPFNPAFTVPPRAYSQFAAMQNPDATPTPFLKSSAKTNMPTSDPSASFPSDDSRPITYEDQLRYDKGLDTNAILMQDGNGNLYTQ